jgi:cell division septum initiation protein DivIVA
METEGTGKTGSGPQRVSDTRDLLHEYLSCLREKAKLEMDLAEVVAEKEDLESRFPALAQIAGQVKMVQKGPVWSRVSAKSGKRYFTIARTAEEANARLRATASGTLGKLEKKAVAVKRKADEDAKELLEKAKVRKKS